MGMLARIDLVREMLGQQEILARVDRMGMLGGGQAGHGQGRGGLSVSTAGRANSSCQSLEERLDHDYILKPSLEHIKLSSSSRTPTLRQ
jgi:hypothetical protein